jgi:hypothetical protein
MKNIPIEEYKGFEISYNTEEDKFECIVALENEEKKKRSSLKELRLTIDEYIKANKTFKPFFVLHHPEHGIGGCEKIKVVGIRKDGIFVYEKKEENGELVKKPFSKYYLKDYILDIPENEAIFKELELLDIKREYIQKREKEINKQVKRTTLLELAKTYQ